MGDLQDVTRKALPYVIIIALLIFERSPYLPLFWQSVPGRMVTPLILTLLYCFPRSLPPISLFLFGLFCDIISERVPGISALLFIAAYLLINVQRGLISRNPPLMRLVIFILNLLLIDLGAMLLTILTETFVQGPSDIFWGNITSFLAMIVLSLVFRKRLAAVESPG